MLKQQLLALLIRIAAIVLDFILDDRNKPDFK